MTFEFISFFNQTLNEFHKQGEKNIHNSFDSHLWLKNEESRFIKNNETFTGVIKNTDLTGQINIDVNGHIKSFNNGEIKYAERLAF